MDQRARSMLDLMVIEVDHHAPNFDDTFTNPSQRHAPLRATPPHTYAPRIE